MKREAFKMYLKPGYEAEYEKRHAAIWPELKALLSKNGVSDYSIYWDRETNILFAFQKTEGEGGSQDLGTTEIVQKWWDLSLIHISSMSVQSFFRNKHAIGKLQELLYRFSQISVL